MTDVETNEKELSKSPKKTNRKADEVHIENIDEQQLNVDLGQE